MPKKHNFWNYNKHNITSIKVTKNFNVPDDVVTSAFTTLGIKPLDILTYNGYKGEDNHGFLRMLNNIGTYACYLRASTKVYDISPRYHSLQHFNFKKEIVLFSRYMVNSYDDTYIELHNYEEIRNGMKLKKGTNMRVLGFRTIKGGFAANDPPPNFDLILSDVSYYLNPTLCDELGAYLCKN